MPSLNDYRQRFLHSAGFAQSAVSRSRTKENLVVPLVVSLNMSLSKYFERIPKEKISIAAAEGGLSERKVSVI